MIGRSRGIAWGKRISRQGRRNYGLCRGTSTVRTLDGRFLVCESCRSSRNDSSVSTVIPTKESRNPSHRACWQWQRMATASLRIPLVSERPAVGIIHLTRSRRRGNYRQYPFLGNWVCFECSRWSLFPQVHHLGPQPQIYPRRHFLREVPRVSPPFLPNTETKCTEKPTERKGDAQTEANTIVTKAFIRTQVTPQVRSAGQRQRSYTDLAPLYSRYIDATSPEPEHEQYLDPVRFPWLRCLSFPHFLGHHPDGRPPQWPIRVRCASKDCSGTIVQ